MSVSLVPIALSDFVEVIKLLKGGDSVLKSRMVEAPHDTQLRMLSKLKSGEFDFEKMDEFRKDLVVKTSEDTYAIQKRKQQEEKKSTMKTKTGTNVVKIGGKYHQHSQLDLVMAELAHSPLNGDENLPADHVKTTESLRQIRFDPSASPIVEISPEFDPQSGDRNKRRNKYALSEGIPSPFFNKETGEPVAVKKTAASKNGKKKPPASRVIEKPKVVPATRRKVKNHPQAWAPRVPANWNGEGGESSGSQEDKKLPTRLRKQCSQQFKDIIQFQRKNTSEKTWKAIKRKHERDRLKRLEEDSKNRILWSSMSDCPDMGYPDNSLVHSSVDIAPEAQSMLGRDMEGLMTLDELEELSHGSDPSDEHHLQDGSAAGLFGAESLMNLHVSPRDHVLLEDFNSPEDVLAGCLGKLLFAEEGKAVKVRPASAGIGGVSKGVISSPVRSKSSRPQTAQPIGSYNVPKTQKRSVLCRAKPTQEWFS